MKTLRRRILLPALIGILSIVVLFGALPMSGIQAIAWSHIRTMFSPRSIKSQVHRWWRSA